MNKGSVPNLAVALAVADREVVVVGGGNVAERKVEALLSAAARVRLIAPELTDRLSELAAEGALSWEARRYRTGDLGNAMLVIVATNDEGVNRVVAAEAAERQRWCNVAAPPDAGSCHFLAHFRRGPITVAIGTEGASPYAARRIRERLEAAVPESWGRLAELMGALRDEVRRIPDEAARRAVYERMWNSDAAALLERGDEAAALAALRGCLP